MYRRGIALVPEFVSGALNGNPAVLQYEAGTHLIHARIGGDFVPIELQINSDYPKSGNIEIKVSPPETMRFPLFLRVPAWTESFVATVGKTRHEGTAGEMLSIERTWVPGDAVGVSISMTIQLRKDPDKNSKKVWFMRGPQVLAVDAQVKENNGLPSGWWGDQVYTVRGYRNGDPIRLLLVPFAEAGQNKIDYSTILEDLELDASAQVRRLAQ